MKKNHLKRANSINWFIFCWSHFVSFVSFEKYIETAFMEKKNILAFYLAFFGE